MGIDLMLLPMDVDYNDSAYAHTILEVQKRNDLWLLIDALPSEPVPPNFETLVSDEGPPEWEFWVQGNTQVDGYNKPLACVGAKYLQALVGHPAVQEEHVNRAVWAYLAQLPADTRIAIYWC